MENAFFRYKSILGDRLARAFRLLRAEPDGGECRLDRVRGPDVDPVLGRKGVEGQEHVPVLGETRGRGWELRGKRGQEEIEGPVGRRLRLRHPDVIEHGFRLGLHARIPARPARAFRVIDNRTSELTSWDTDLLPDALSGLNDLDIFSFDDVLPLAATAGKTDPDDIPETPKNPVSRVGDIWTLGKHRLMCGDATKPEHRLRHRDRARLR